jgi:hypothetical protein
MAPEAAKYNAHSIGVRPEHFALLSRENATGAWKGKVGVAEQLGSDTFLHVQVEGLGLTTIRTDGDQTFSHGDDVYLSPDQTRIYKFDAARQRDLGAIHGVDLTLSLSKGEVVADKFQRTRLVVRQAHHEVSWARVKD